MSRLWTELNVCLSCHTSGWSERRTCCMKVPKTFYGWSLTRALKRRVGCRRKIDCWGNSSPTRKERGKLDLPAHLWDEHRGSAGALPRFHPIISQSLSMAWRCKKYPLPKPLRKFIFSGNDQVLQDMLCICIEIVKGNVVIQTFLPFLVTWFYSLTGGLLSPGTARQAEAISASGRDVQGSVYQFGIRAGQSQRGGGHDQGHISGTADV